MENKISQEKIDSIFDIAGRDENALSRAFGAMIREDKKILEYLLKIILDKKIPISKKLFSTTQLYFEKHGKDGRTDIEIVNDKLHLIIESKIGNNKAAVKQAVKYCKERLRDSPSKKKIFIFLTEVGNIEPEEIKGLKNEFKNVLFGNLSWGETLKIIQKRKKISINLVNEYENYLSGGLSMKIHDIDLWAVSVTDKQQIENFDKYAFYRNNKKHNPFLIGLREYDKSLKKSVIKRIRPVLYRLDPGSKEIKDYTNNRKWGVKENEYIYILGRELVLEKPIRPKDIRDKNGKPLKKFNQASARNIDFQDISK